MKAQISIFMILVVLMIIGFFTVLYIAKPEWIGVDVDDSNKITKYVEGEAKITLEDGLVLLGRQGGRITLKEPILEAYSTSILLKDNISYVPTIEEMKQELENYIKNNLKVNFSKLEGMKLLKEGEIVPEIAINEEDVTLTLNYSLDFQVGKKTITTEKYLVLTDINLLKMHDIIKEIVDFQIRRGNLKNDNVIQATKFEFRIGADQGNLLIKITDPETQINSMNYKFFFTEQIE